MKRTLLVISIGLLFAFCNGCAIEEEQLSHDSEKEKRAGILQTPHYSGYRPRPKPMHEEIAIKPDPDAAAEPKPMAITSRPRAMPHIVVRGIVYSKKNPSALIGNKILHVGDVVSGAKIVRITEQSVVFDVNGSTWRQGVSK